MPSNRRPSYSCHSEHRCTLGPVEQNQNGVPHFPQVLREAGVSTDRSKWCAKGASGGVEGHAADREQ
jgi:hypothetical protein